MKFIRTIDATLSFILLGTASHFYICPKAIEFKILLGDDIVSNLKAYGDFTVIAAHFSSANNRYLNNRYYNSEYSLLYIF